MNWEENNPQDVEKDVRKVAGATGLSPSGLLLGMCLEPVAPRITSFVAGQAYFSWATLTSDG